MGELFFFFSASEKLETPNWERLKYDTEYCMLVKRIYGDFMKRYPGQIVTWKNKSPSKSHSMSQLCVLKYMNWANAKQHSSCLSHGTGGKRDGATSPEGCGVFLWAFLHCLNLLCEAAAMCDPCAKNISHQSLPPNFSLRCDNVNKFGLDSDPDRGRAMTFPLDKKRTLVHLR